MAKITYYKLGKKSQSFFDPTTGLQVKPTCPGKLEKEPSKKIQNAEVKGFITQITEQEYNTLMAVRAMKQKAAESKRKSSLAKDLEKLQKRYGSSALKALLGSTEEELPKELGGIQLEEEVEEEEEVTALSKEELEEMELPELTEYALTTIGLTKKSIKGLSKEELIEKILE